MSVIKRIQRIISANINSLMEKAEDPDTMLKQLIREMDEDIVALRMEVAKAIAAEKRIGRRLEETEKQVQTWEQNSESAVREGNDDLARKAIERKLSEQEKLSGLMEQHKKAVVLSTTLKEKLQILEDKVQEAKSKMEILVVRKRTAETQKSVLSATQNVTRFSERGDLLLSEMEAQNPISLDALEDQVIQLETEMEAMQEVMRSTSSLDDVFEESRKKEDIEKNLKELKEKMGNQ